jgi:acyl-coenzyme A thioesterase 9
MPGLEQTTNDFRFTWCPEGREEASPRKVVPKTYKGKRQRCTIAIHALPMLHFPEAMLWLEGKRALEMGAEIRELRSQPDERV